VRFCRVDPSALATHPLLPAAMDTLAASNAVPESVLEATVDLVVDILRKYDARPEHMPLVGLVVPRVMGLEPRYHAAVASGDQEDWVRGIARVITEMAESYTDLLLSPNEMNQAAVVRLVLACTANADHAIAEMTLRFWYFFVKRWHELRDQELKGALQLK